MYKFRLFIGCLITPELRLQLNQSVSWKQAKIGLPQQDDLVENHYNQKDYIGVFTNGDSISFSELQQTGNRVKESLKSYCPHFSSEKIRILVFSQIFIS